MYKQIMYSMHHLRTSHPQSKMILKKKNHYQAVVNLFVPEGRFYFASK